MIENLEEKLHQGERRHSKGAKSNKYKTFQ